MVTTSEQFALHQKEQIFSKELYLYFISEQNQTIIY